jgi:WD40 repeat protein
MRCCNSLALLCAIVFTIDAAAQEKAKPAFDQFGDPLPEGAVARIGTVRWNGRITTELAYSPDGKKLAAQCSDQSVRIYDPENGRELQRFRANGDVEYFEWNWEAEAQPAWKNKLPRLPSQGSMRLPCLSANRRVAVTTEKRVRVVDNTTDKILGFFGPLEKPEIAVVSPDGAILAVADNADYSIHLWDVARVKKLGQCLGHENNLVTLIFSPDGKSLVSSAADLTVCCWEPTTGKQRWKFQGTGANISTAALCYSPDGKTLAAGGWNGYVYLLDAITGKERDASRSTRNERDGWVNTLAYHPDGKRLYIGTEGGCVRECDSTTGREIRRLKEPAAYSFSKQKKQIGGEDWNHGLACSPDAKNLALGGMKGLFLWNLAERQPLMRELKGAGITFCVDFSPDGRKLASGNVSLHVWDLAADKKVGDIPSPGKSGFRTLAFSPDGRTVATGGWDNWVRLWDIESAKERGDFALPQQLHQVVFSPCGRFVAALDWYGTLRFWEIAATQDRTVFRVNNRGTQAVAISPDGRWLAIGGTDQLIHVFDIHSGNEVHQYKGHEGWIEALAFSPSGETLASGGHDSTALIWDARLLSRHAKHAKKVLEADELEAAWRELLNKQSQRLPTAIDDLVTASDQSVTFLQKACPPVDKSIDAKIQEQLRKLGSEVFTEREKAMKDLHNLGEPAISALKKMQLKPTSLEALRRADELLARLQLNPVSPDTLRAIRTVEVLEKIGTPKARQVLMSLAEGAMESRLTQEASFALKRLGAQGKARK